ncbi:hypothetical protein E5344_02035 [Microbacterium laevaniformans]|uniref:Uncharacterized protein n=1 Tax=Microbacterium laevaniformans TaxID=36807 RepID=A0A4S2DC28_9MICO|nr:hypothetical protein [Microbacterium laevaniformans]TGY39407.1 hypothetical protein E5344_02035 [Microbacterium laevaniformans]
MSDSTPDSDVFPASAADALAPDAPEALQRPRIRWAGIVWGLVFAALATVGAALTWTPRALENLSMIVPQLSGTTLVAATLMALGALALISGLVGLLRHAQRAATRRRA